MFNRYINIQQHDEADCGAAVIATILKTYKKEMTIMKIRELIGTDAYGTSIQGIVDGLKKLKFDVKAIRTDSDDITSDVTFPAIAAVKNGGGINHLVVVHSVSKKQEFVIADPVGKILKQSKQEFDEWFTGILIVCVPTSQFEQVKLKNKNILSLYKMLIFPQKNLFLTVILASFILSILGIFSGIFSKILIDEIIPYQMKNTLFLFLIIFCTVSLIQNLLSGFRQYVLFFLSRKIDIPLLLGYYNHIIHLPYFFFTTRKTGDIFTRFQDAMTIKDIFASITVSLILDITLSVIVGIVLVNINFPLFCILIVVILMNIMLIYFFKKPYKEFNLQQMESASSLNSQIIESLKNIETIKSLNNEQHQIDKLETKYVHLLKISYKEGVLQSIQATISSSVGSIGNLLFMGIGALYVINQKMTFGDLLIFQTLSQYLVDPIKNLVSLQMQMQDSQIAISRLKELMDLEIENENNKLMLTNIDLSGDIVFQNVSFSYGSRAPILKNFSLDIEAGSKVAIVGESGSGKSTLARLLLKFIEIDSGKIIISNSNILDINHEYLRKKIAYIPQNIELFSGTILENLKIGNLESTYEEIILASQRAGAARFIEKLPNRYQSFVEEDGINFSGGEKQRLAIARSLLSNPDLFIFDEATSYLDVYSEKIIQNFIFKKVKKSTVIIIAHRLSTILNCDKIILLEDGKIIEQGTHEELLLNCDKYVEMMNLQNGIQNYEKKLKTDAFMNSEEMVYE